MARNVSKIRILLLVEPFFSYFMDQNLWKSLTFLSLKSVKSRFSQLAVPPVVLLLYFAKQKDQNLINNFAFFWKKGFCFPPGKVKIGLLKSFEHGRSYGKNRAHVAAEVQWDNTTLAVPRR